MVGLIGWYAYTVLGVVSPESQAALDKKAAELAKGVTDLAKRSETEGFRVEHYDACDQIRDQYRIPIGVVYTEFTQRQLVGLPKTASDRQVKERCVQFAKAVVKMEKMSHHIRHVYLCQKAQFNADPSGKYFLTADPKGRGVTENRYGASKFTPIPQGEFILMRGWQIYNQGDGCLIIGLPKSGTFTMRGAVQINE